MSYTNRLVTLVVITLATTFAPIVAMAQTPSSSRSTSVRNVGIGPFADVRKARVASAMKTLADAAIMRVNARTYMKAKPITSTLSLVEKSATLKSALASNGVEGLLVAEVSDFDLRWNLVGPLGQTLASGKIDVPALATDADVALAADRLVDGVAASIPYRTFITKEIGPDVFEIGMGKNAGVVKGQKLRIFDLSGSDFSASRSNTGVVEVVQVNDETAEVEGISGRSLGVYQKVAFDDRSRGMSLDEPSPAKGYFMLGGGLFTLNSTSPSPAYDQKLYRLSSTPALVLGAGFGKFELSASFAQAQNTTEDLVYTEILIDRMFAGNLTGLWGWKFMGGVRVASYRVTKDTNATSQLESINAVSPHASIHFEKYVAGPLSVTAGAEAMPLTFYSPSSGGSVLFSYGGSISGGIRFDLNPRWTIEAITRISTFRRPVDGQSAVQESHSNVNGTVKLRF